MRLSGYLALFLLVLLWEGAFSWAEDGRDAPKNGTEKESSFVRSFSKIENRVEKFTLKNGLRVLYYRRSWAPIFVGQIWVKVGGVDESVGITGIAHLLEHMAFKGSKTIGTSDFDKEKPLLAQLEDLLSLNRPDGSILDSERYQAIDRELEKYWVSEEFSRIYQAQGAVGLNAGTAKDFTFYTVSLPSVAFELWCWMESDRLLNPVFRQFYKEREVVLEERRSRVDDNPDGLMYEALLSTAFWAHPNRLPVIGWASDVGKLTATKVKEFYDTYYRPDNMVLVLVGDLRLEYVKPQLEKYFGRLPIVSKPLPVINTTEVPQKGKRIVEVEFDANPALIMAFHKPTYPHVDDVYFTVLHNILGNNRSSEFYKELVQRKQVATSVYTSEAPGARYDPVFVVGATPRQGVSYEKLEDEIYAVLDRLKQQLVSSDSLEAAKRQLQVDILHSLSSNYGVSHHLANSELLWGDYRTFFRFYEDLMKTRREDIMAVAKKYFTTSNSTVVRLVRSGAKER